jgi:hypothetical protein
MIWWFEIWLSFWSDVMAASSDRIIERDENVIYVKFRGKAR